MNTRKDLHPLVEKLTDHPLRKKLIADAKAGRFHDFDTEEATPKMLLVQTLMELCGLTGDKGYRLLANRVANGEFDE